MAARTALPAPHPPPLAVTMNTFIVLLSAAAACCVASASVTSVVRPPKASTAHAAIRYFFFISSVRYLNRDLIPQKSLESKKARISPYTSKDERSGTTDRTRTGTPRRTADFKSAASTNSATVACGAHLKVRYPIHLRGAPYRRDWISSIVAFKEFLRSP